MRNAKTLFGNAVASLGKPTACALLAAPIITFAALFGGAAPGPAAGQNSRVVLITAEEAKRPAAQSGSMTMRAGISRGPDIELLSPSSVQMPVHSPLHLQLKFLAHGGAQVDESSFKLIDVTTPAVDLSDRVRGFTSPAGLDVPDAEVPAGSYAIRAEIKDRDGRIGILNFQLNVVQ